MTSVILPPICIISSEYLFFSRVLLLGGRDRREGGWMSKGEERRVLRNREEKFGWSGERELSFPSYIYFLTILSVSHLSNFDSRFFCSFGRFTSSEDRWKASAQLEGEEDCEVLTTMGLIHQGCVCTNLCLRTNHRVECNLVCHWDNK